MVCDLIGYCWMAQCCFSLNSLSRHNYEEGGTDLYLFPSNFLYLISLGDLSSINVSFSSGSRI